MGQTGLHLHVSLEDRQNLNADAIQGELFSNVDTEEIKRGYRGTVAEAADPRVSELEGSRPRSLGLNAEWLRYYLAAKLSARNEDIDFNADDFMARVNSDLVGKFINIASRAAGLDSGATASSRSRMITSAGRVRAFSTALALEAGM